MTIFKSKFQRRKYIQLTQFICIISLTIVVGTQILDKTNTYTSKTSQSSNGTYQSLDIAACDTSGYRKPNTVVNIGVNSDVVKREYFAYTNSTSQLVYVEADKLILQDDDFENVTNNGRYCQDEAKVRGSKNKEYDEGHVIADSLGGVSNSYNITPQNSQLNRNGEQYQFEELIRNSGGATNFKAFIYYPNQITMIPSSYKITFQIDKENYIYEFENK